ncbi:MULTISPECIES: TssQ family T6SS-associated lipoprotein [unclassified Acidovorax]|jgi:hypothetical protein|uniref:TssQ family T6SS-associated lipoprotein n=1 Tax=unclassified Acidovorax TaxID=2684926 RepID=UPI000AC669A5|nr:MULTISPECIES: TssQ family T6SS-associated lipoprotein [unclassified Acidovorax]
MRNRFWSALIIGCASLFLTACETTPKAPEPKVEAPPPAPPIPEPVAPVDPRAQKEALLTEALSVYAEGQFDEAIAKLTPLADAPELPLTSQIKARKFMAFSHCAAGRPRPCRQQFELALEQDPTFQLTEAEKGHPVWGREFINARNAARNKRGARKTP